MEKIPLKKPHSALTEVFTDFIYFPAAERGLREGPSEFGSQPGNERTEKIAKKSRNSRKSG